MFFKSRICVQIFRFRNKSFLTRSFCKDAKDKAALLSEEKKIKEKQNNNTDETAITNAKQRLLSLLTDMRSDDIKMAANLAKPKPRRVRKKEPQPKPKSDVSEEVLTAIKSVASTAAVGGEQIEQDLIDSIQSMSSIEQDDTDKIDGDVDIGQNAVNELSEQTTHMMSSVKEVAAEVHVPPGSFDSEITPQSELTKKLLSLSSDFKSTKATGNASIEKLFHGMRVENADARTDHPTQQQPSQERMRNRRDDNTTRRDSSRQTAPLNIFSGPALNVFTTEKTQETERKDLFWLQLEEKSLQSLVQFAPANALEEMIVWTKQEKHWKFPIDNEFNMGAEEEVGFHEHVFLEQHLHGFPTKGPIRHFMELVTIGLSKNPYISVDRKIENIDWFRAYFKEKEHILREYNVLDDK